MDGNICVQITTTKHTIKEGKNIEEHEAAETTTMVGCKSESIGQRTEESAQQVFKAIGGASQYKKRCRRLGGQLGVWTDGKNGVRLGG